MESHLYDIAYLIQFKDRVNLNVSKVPISWHLDHSLKVVNKICLVLKNSDPAIYENRFHLLRWVILTFRYIPRGKGKSPGAVLPPDTIKTEDLLKQLENARENLKAMVDLHPNANFVHPVFGQLNKKKAMRFLHVHTKHHLGIIRDILGKE